MLLILKLKNKAIAMVDKKKKKHNASRHGKHNVVFNRRIGRYALCSYAVLPLKPICELTFDVCLPTFQKTNTFIGTLLPIKKWQQTAALRII